VPSRAWGFPQSSLSSRSIVSKRLGSSYRSGRSKHWIKVKNPKAPAVKREAEEDWAADVNDLSVNLRANNQKEAEHAYDAPNRNTNRNWQSGG